MVLVIQLCEFLTIAQLKIAFTIIICYMTDLCMLHDYRKIHTSEVEVEKAKN